MDEREFLLRLALDHWRSVYGLAVDDREFDIRSMTKHVDFDLAYEIQSIRVDDQFRIHLYLNIGQIDRIDHSFIGVSPNQSSGTLDDEQYVLMGSVDDRHRLSDGYTWGVLDWAPDRTSVVIQESGALVTYENGDLIVLATGTM